MAKPGAKGEEKAFFAKQLLTNGCFAQRSQVESLWPTGPSLRKEMCGPEETLLARAGDLQFKFSNNRGPTLRTPCGEKESAPKDRNRARSFKECAGETTAAAPGSKVARGGSSGERAKRRRFGKGFGLSGLGVENKVGGLVTGIAVAGGYLDFER